MLEAMSSEEILSTALDDLLRHPVSCSTTSIRWPILDPCCLKNWSKRFVAATKSVLIFRTPEYRFRNVRDIDSSEVLVVDQQTAQAQVRIECRWRLQRGRRLLANLYTSYFGSGMSSVVFQELREARALAYSASARYSAGSRINAENLMMGSIGTQTDKTVDALAAFIDLIDNMPSSFERFEESVNSMLNRYALQSSISAK